jgi:Domain of unknown function (DU1801)
MQSKAKTVKEYLNELPEERRDAIEAVRKVILKNLPKGYEEVMDGMICYVVPLKLYPAGYLDNQKTPLAYVGLASQKNNMAVYLTNIYYERDKALHEWFHKAYKASGKKMDIGKSCVRFTKLENLPLDVIGQAVAKTPVKEFITIYENSRKKK